MARRSGQSVLEDLMELPWWVSVAFAATIYPLVRFVVPAILSGQLITADFGQAAKQYAWVGQKAMHAVWTSVTAVRPSTIGMQTY